jgi:membrane protease YdiL (CAAX protease family)
MNTDPGPGAGGQGPGGPGDSGEIREAPNPHIDSAAAETPLGEPPPDPWSAATGPEAPSDVFWGYAELFLFVGLAIPAMLAGFGLVRTVLALFRLHPSRAAEVLAEQFLGYFFLFLILVVIFRFQYGRPFWESLGWRPFTAPPILLVAAGWLTAFAVVVIGVLMRTPNTSNALTELMQDRVSLILVAAFGITLGPLAEELAFRGFAQPLLVKSFGTTRGILVAALPFGMLHFAEYGYSWRHVVLITAAGAAFGWMRHKTGSTKAATIMHSAYNTWFFVSLWLSKQSS